MRIIIQPTKSELPPFDEYTNEIRDIFSTGMMTNNGPKVEKFQCLLEKRTGCNNILLFANGHLALALGIASMGLPAGGEVLTSGFTFVSTTNAIVQNNLIPVFCDIDETYNISIDSIEKNITDKTCAIVTPHIFGIPCHVEEIDIIAKKYGIKVIYDAAQAFGTKVGGRDLATFGDGTMFSFHAIKVLNSIEGGAFCFKDDSLTRFLVENRNFGVCIEDKMNADYIGINAKMDEFRASMGIVNLNHIDEVIEKRKALAEYYCKRLSEIDGISTYKYDLNTYYNYGYFPVIIDHSVLGINRDELFDRLNEKGIGTRKLYSRLTCDYKSFKNAGYRADVSYARKVADCCLDLPIYASLKEVDIDLIVNEIKALNK